MPREREDRLAEWRALIDICFTLLDKLKTPEIAKRSGLSLTTVYNLKAGNVSLDTHINTIQSLVETAGLRMTFNQGGVTLRLRTA